MARLTWGCHVRVVSASILRAARFCAQSWVRDNLHVPIPSRDILAVLARASACASVLYSIILKTLPHNFSFLHFQHTRQNLSAIKSDVMMRSSVFICWTLLRRQGSSVGPLWNHSSCQLTSCHLSGCKVRVTVLMGARAFRHGAAHLSSPHSRHW